MFLDMYMKITKPSRVQKEEIAHKEPNSTKSSRKITCRSNSKNCEEEKKNETTCNHRQYMNNNTEADQSLPNHTNLISDIDECMEKVVREAAETNDNFRFMDDNSHIINESFDDESHNTITKEKTTTKNEYSFENKYNQLIGMNSIPTNINSVVEESGDLHCNTIFDNFEYFQKSSVEGRSDLERSFRKSLSFDNIKTYPDINKSVNNVIDLETSDSCSKSEVKFANEISFFITKSYTNNTELTPGVGESTNRRDTVPIDFDQLIKIEPGLFSISQRYAPDSSEKKMFSPNNNTLEYQNNDTMEGNITTQRSNFGPRNILCSKEKRERLFADIHPAEKLESKIFREEVSRNRVDDFKKPKKKRMSHYINENSFPLTAVEEQYKKPKLCNDTNSLLDSDEAGYTKKSIKWRSPLVFSPAVKFSPRIDRLMRTTSENGIQNDFGNGTIETSISSRNSIQTGNVTLDSQRTSKPYKGGQHSSSDLKQRGTKFPLRDDDYEDISKLLTSKEFSEIFETSFLEDMKTKSEKCTPIKNSQSNNTSSATDYYTQFLNQSLGYTEEQHEKPGSQKSQPSLNWSSNENQENETPNIEKIPKNKDVSQSSFEFEDNNINYSGRSFSTFNDNHLAGILIRENSTFLGVIALTSAHGTWIRSTTPRKVSIVGS
ncbi:unnamed protein product [Phaedon cochleariae]|uniref:Uncharacterized protein n=1 Tax=Phaedon cochleariae TaxID=80249 RepID=A0A9P0GNB6_PHACE|nr:unnamed protein product [Phaedon cochleariae]